MGKRIKEVLILENLAKEKGWENLQWLSFPGDWFLKQIGKSGFITEKTKYTLCGRPKNYNGFASDYTEPILVGIRSKFEIVGYKWVEGNITKKYVRD